MSKVMTELVLQHGYEEVEFGESSRATNEGMRIEMQAVEAANRLEKTKRAMLKERAVHEV